MKLLKILGIVLGTLVVLMVIAGVLLTLFFDPNDYKPQIERTVEEHTGRQFAIEGDIGLSLFPWLGVETGPARLNNPEGFDPEPFAAVNAVNVRVKLLPLLQRRVEADTITLDGLRLHLIRNEDGRGNWEDLAAAEVPEEVPLEEEVPPGEPAPALAGLAVSGLRVTDARITWDDRMSGNHVVISDFGLRSGAFTPGEPIDVQSDFHVQSRQPELAGQVGLKGNLTADVDAQRYAFHDGELDLDLAGEGLPPEGFQGRVNLSAETDLAQQVADITQLAGNLAGIQVDARLKGENILEQPNFSGTVRVAEFNPRELFARLGMEAPATTDPQVLQVASFNSSLQAGTDAVQLNSLELRLDETRLTGNLSIRDFANPAVRFDLAADGIDLDRYLPPAAEAQPGTGNGGSAAGGGQAAVPVGLPVDMLRDLNLKGSLNVGQLKVNNLTTTQALLEVDAQNGLVRIDPLRAELYGGQAEGSISVDARGEEPGLAMNQRISGIQVNPLLIDLTGNDVLAGTGEFSVNVTARGLTPEALERSLNGEAAFNFADGAIKGINVARMIREARARLRGESLPEADMPNQTDFTELTGTATITDGVIVNRDFSAKSPLLRITGEGVVDLPQEQIDYLVRTVIVGTLEGQRGRELEELKGIPIPIRVSGSLTEPRFAPDIQAALGEQVRERVEERVEQKREEIQEEVEERIRERVGDEVQERIRGLFR